MSRLARNPAPGERPRSASLLQQKEQNSESLESHRQRQFYPDYIQILYIKALYIVCFEGIHHLSKWNMFERQGDKMFLSLFLRGGHIAQDNY